MDFAEFKSADELVASTRMLIVDGDYHMRKVVRSLLLSVGIRAIEEAPNGAEGLDAICKLRPDAVIVDWAMPDITGSDFIKIVRSPESFPLPDIPLILLTGYVDRERLVEAVRLGFNEILTKPVSARALRDRILSVRARPRPMVRIGDYYGPEPRKVASKPKQPAESGEPAWAT
jgi:CheY-like chemotaxis protein